MWQDGEFSGVFYNLFSGNFPAQLSAGLPACNAVRSPTGSSPEGRVLQCALDTGEGSGFFRRVPWATALASAAPPAGLQGLGPELDPSAVPIFMGIQRWDLATDSLKELLNINGVLRACLHHDGTYGLSVFLRVLQGHLPDI